MFSIESICVDSNLSKREQSARDRLIMGFNPVLKLTLASGNISEFTRYEYNSCRQSAVFASRFLYEELPNYTIQTFEGKFHDFVCQHPVEYIHYFCSATKGNRTILVDMSRTTRKLLFYPVTDDRWYPMDFGYEQMEAEWIREVNWVEMFESEGGEYFTGIRPNILYGKIMSILEGFERNPRRQIDFAEEMYAKFTKIIGGDWI